MKISPALDYPQTRSFKQRCPRVQIQHILPSLHLLRAAIKSKATRQETCVRHENDKARIVLCDTAHLLQSLRLVEEMLKRSHAGHKIERSLMEGQRFGRTTVKVRARKPCHADIYSPARQIYA